MSVSGYIQVHFRAKKIAYFPTGIPMDLLEKQLFVSFDQRKKCIDTDDYSGMDGLEDIICFIGYTDVTLNVDIDTIRGFCKGTKIRHVVLVLKNTTELRIEIWPTDKGESYVGQFIQRHLREKNGCFVAKDHVGCGFVYKIVLPPITQFILAKIDETGKYTEEDDPNYCYEEDKESWKDDLTN